MPVKEFRESWVTTALSDQDAIQALVLAMSLRQVVTTRNISVIITESVTPNMRNLLYQVFHGVTLISDMDMKSLGLLNGGTKFLSQLWCWRLLEYEKCVFLEPNYLVEKNCDTLFDYHDFSALKEQESSDQLDLSLFVFKPNMVMFDKLVAAAAPDAGTDVLVQVLGIPNTISDISIAEMPSLLELQFNDLLRFRIRPSLMNLNGTECNGYRKWIKISQEILPFIRNQMELSVKALSAEMLEDNDDQYRDTIAVVGMSCRLPGANDPAEYWKLLSEGRDAIRRFPSDRPYDGPSEAKKMQAGFLNCPIDEFDSKFFGISPREAVMMDPQQRLLLEVSWECLENAGINPQTLRGSDTGVFVGMWQQDYEEIIRTSKQHESSSFLHFTLGNQASATASRISFFLGLHGPALAVESGCASSLNALHLACESLRKEETSLALASGVNLVLLPQSPFSQKPIEETDVILSSDYKCKTFDESADGYVRAEGCGVVALKRFIDARRDGDKILAVVSGSAVNNVGPSTSFGTPNAIAPEQVFRAALKEANALPTDISFIETHGTGTAVGDPIEMQAIKKVYSTNRAEPLLLGSVKTNIGHSESAAGIASVIKVILCMQHEAIPPHLNFKTLNPKIDLDSIPARIPMKLTPWIASTKIAAISSFSLTGTNAHVIIQQPTKLNIIEDVLSAAEMITVSAKSEDALTALVQKYIHFLQHNQGLPLRDIAYEVNCGRAHLQHRIAVVATDTAQLRSHLEKRNFEQHKVPSGKSKVGFLFTGQGSQYFGMTKGLAENFPAFKKALQQCNVLFQNNLKVNLMDVLFTKENLLNQTLICQPAIFCVEYCLVRLWNFFGLRPDCVLGHSVGEFAAAVCAGILTLEDSMRLVVDRSRLVNGLPVGSMLAIKASEEEASEIISAFGKAFECGGEKWIDIAAVNSVNEIVVSGSCASIEALQSYCSALGIKYVQISAAHAFHSRAMDSILTAFGIATEAVSVGSLNCAYISGTLAKSMEVVEFGSEYWQRHLRDTVRFADSVKLMWLECKTLVEIGTQSTLLGLTMANIDDPNGQGIFCPSQRRNEDPSSTFRTAMKKLYLTGVGFDWKSVYGTRQKVLSLPTYPFQRQKYWVSYDEEIREINPVIHPLLGRQFLSPVSDMIFYHTLRLKELSYLEDHKVADCIVIPGATMLENFLAACRQVLHGGSRNQFAITIEDFSIPTVFPLENQCQVQTLITAENGTSNNIPMKYHLTLDRKSEHHFDKWKRQATATCTQSYELNYRAIMDLELLKETLNYRKSLELTYQAFAGVGISFGPRFQTISCAWFGPDDVLAEIHLPENHSDYVCHPIVLDAMIQTCAIREHFSGVEKTKRRRSIAYGLSLYLPSAIRKFTWISRIESTTVLAHSSGETDTVTLYSPSGETLAVMEGLEFIPTRVSSVLRAIRQDAQEIPDFLCDKWRSVLGKMDARLDISQAITLTEQQRAESQSEKYEDKSHKNAYALLNMSILHIFFKTIQELEWPWPAIGETLHSQQWEAVLPGSMNKKIVQIYLAEFEARGFLTEIKASIYQILQALPSKFESDRIIQENIELIRSNYSEFEVEIEFMERYRVYLRSVLQGKMTPLSYLFPENESDHGALYLYTQSVGYNQPNLLVVSYLCDIISQCQSSASKDSVVRILEIGAGSGSTAIQCIAEFNKLKISYHYTFTDISAVFLNEAKKKLGTGSEISYKIFNIENDPLAQGFCPEEFDVIIGNEVVHATANIHESLSNLKKVLRVGGILIMGEQFRANPLITFTFGMLDGWWRFNDFRQNSKMTALLNEVQWSASLKEVQFENVSTLAEGVIWSAISAHNASKYHCVKSPGNTKTWCVISDSSRLSESVSQSLRDYDREVVSFEFCSNFKYDEEYWSNVFSSYGDSLEGVLCFFTKQELCTIVDYQSRIVSTLLGLLKAYEASSGNFKLVPKLVVVTRGVYSIGDSGPGNPQGATAWGVMKVFLNESPYSRINLIDLDSTITSFETSQIFAQIWIEEDEPFIAFRQDKTFVRRLTHMDRPNLPIQLPSTDRYKFINPESNSFNDIEMGPTSREVPKDDEVEVQVRASALNFRDLFMVMQPEGFERDVVSKDSVGLDFSGVVVSVGRNVKRFQVRDEVFGICRNGTFRTHVVTSERDLLRIPKQTTFTEACTIPAAFLTAHMSLIKVAKITASDRVLIHVASGGLGLAAVQVAKSVGADIFATAGNKRKRAYLRSLGIKYVYHSRNTSYGEGIERDTNGVGVTVVLNSLTGPGFKETTLKICSPGARFIELSKLNIWEPNEIKWIRADIKYTIIDLYRNTEKDAHSERKINPVETMIQIEKLLSQRIYRSLPFVTFPIIKIRDAFIYMEKAKHIGKIVLEMPETALASSNGRLEHNHLQFNSKSAYMITGGLGGIGLEVTKWMLTKGAQTILLVGRNQPSESVQHQIDNWNRDGGNIVVFQTDIGDYESCQRTLELIKTMGLPQIRGIMHAAGVLLDAPINKQTLESFEFVFKPKVYGGWYLHTLTLDYPLEFFIMFSSMAAIVGLRGQSNHVAANEFLDAMAHYRVSIGLPATTINWGAWSDVGAAAHIGHTTELLAGFRIFTPAQGIAALENIMTSSNTQVGVSEVDWNIVKNILNQGRYIDEVLTSNEENAGVLESYDSLESEILDANTSEERQVKIQIYVELLLKKILALPFAEVLDIDQNFNHFGVDSLMSMDMRNQFKSILGTSNLSLSAMQENRTIRSLSAHIADLIEAGPVEALPIGELVLQDAALPMEIYPAERSAVKPSEYKEVLLTGATGHIGVHCLFELMKSRPDMIVHCLVRGNSDREAEGRLFNFSSRYGINLNNTKNIRVVVGDMSKDRLGFSEQTYSKLAEDVDGILHFAEKVNHVDKYSEGSRHDMRSHNVAGVVNILKFATHHKNKPVLFASSIAACNQANPSGVLVEEYPDKHDMGHELSWGYQLSKLVEDKVVREAYERGVPVTSLRFPMVLGSSETGFMPPGYNIFWTAILASVRVRMIPKGLFSNIPIMTADSAAKVTTALFLNGEAERGVYNLTLDSTFSESGLKETLNEYNICCEIVPYSKWQKAVFENSDTLEVLGPLKAMFLGTPKLGIFTPFTLTREALKLSNFSVKMIRNVPEIAQYVGTAESVLRCQFKAHFIEAVVKEKRLNTV